MRYQLLEYIFINTDLTYNDPRSIDAPKGNDYVPLAPRTTLTGGISVVHPSGFSGSLKTRFIADRPANEDYSLTAIGYNIIDINANYRFKKGVTLGFTIQNVLNTAWKETQFATESRLRTEAEAVTEINFTPGTPFNAKASVSYSF